MSFQRHAGKPNQQPLSASSDKQKQELLRDLLSQVSRSFYLSLKWLPVGVREPISLAYLLARTSDTIADTTWLPPDERLAVLESFANRVSGTSSAAINLKELAKGQGDPAEGILLGRIEASLALLARTSASDHQLIRQVLETIISGQSLDLKRFANASESSIVALDSVAELEDYTYRVAGCVGEFWTEVCLSNLGSRCSLPAKEMLELGARYGTGLQLVNILRDLPRDLRQGRCYLPTEQLRTAGLTPEVLLTPESESKLRPIYDSWLDEAEARLLGGWQYTNAYPRSLARIRISCALPILIGRQTLARLRTGRVLDPSERIKVSRWDVKKLVVRTIASHPIESLWQRLGN